MEAIPYYRRPAGTLYPRIQKNQRPVENSGRSQQLTRTGCITLLQPGKGKVRKAEAWHRYQNVINIEGAAKDGNHLQIFIQHKQAKTDEAYLPQLYGILESQQTGHKMIAPMKKPVCTERNQKGSQQIGRHAEYEVCAMRQQVKGTNQEFN